MTKKKKIRLGSSDFKSMIESNAYYVDKSLFIKEVIDASNDVILIPRPRRFGKTLNLSMLNYFFDIQQPENKKLFLDLQIWKCEEEVKIQQGKYPVIYLSFKDAKGENWDNCFNLIKIEIFRLFQQHRYLLDSSSLYEEDIERYKKILKLTASEADYKSSLKFLSNYLYRHYKTKSIILIDEYDTPIQSSYNNFYKEVVDFMRGFMSAAFKDNLYLYKGVITGILLISKDSIFSGLNNIGVYSIIKNKFAENFGFKEDEVKGLLHYYNMDVSFKKVKSWYDGYKFGNIINVYNPWSILSLVSDWQEEGKVDFSTYWINTSSNDLIKNQIKDKGNVSIRSEILKLINGEVIEKDIEENFVFSDLKTRKQLLWTLLTYSGYLTVEEKVSSFQHKLRIPNYEVKTIFKRTILDWFEYDINVGKLLLEDTIYALVNNDLNKFEKGFKQIIGDTFSYYDNIISHEYIYHAYLLGLLAIIGDDYMIKSNRESGEGRYDVMVIPHDKTKRGVVIEIKRIDKQKENESKVNFYLKINKKIEEAKNQIDRNRYYKELIDNGISKENIVKAVIVFAGKEPFVNKLII